MLTVIEIRKGQPPEGLIVLAREAAEQGLTSSEAYATLMNPLKTDVLECLMQEQGHLCAYCMRRIPDERSGIPHQSIEHRLAQHPKDGEDSGQGLDYANFLAVCSGNRGGKGRGKTKLTCDAHRHNNPLTVNPTDPTTLKTIFYSENGDIGASDPIINNDLVVTLNLNCVSDGGSLSASRKGALDAVQQELVEISDTPESLLKACHELLKKFEAEADPKTPYVGIVIWKLKQYIEMQKDS